MELMTIKELMSYLNIGRNQALKIGAESGARVELAPKTIRYKKSIIDEYIEKNRKGA